MESNDSGLGAIGHGAWDSAAADYEELVTPFTAHYARAALDLLDGAVPGARIIDVAAGTGAFAIAAAQAGAQVCASDFSPGMVARLADQLAPFRDCEALVMDGQALSCESAAFDIAVSIFGVMLFPDWRSGLSELARVIRPGGRGCVAVWQNIAGAGPAFAFTQAYRAAFPDRAMPVPGAGIVHLSDPARLAEAMRDAGFLDVVIHPVQGVWQVASIDTVMRDMDRLYGPLPLFASLDGHERTIFARHLRSVFEVHQSGEGVKIPATALVALGRR
ncbi:class I SAM-dependent methyltransferase [Novosphingobium sp. AP12]|uniref:class I SAM-dependent methyltransferase n=1 Tax=Novosphingobium sp. AP12 TaxID=1144305 RepID=UPI000272001A|nr:methyltransferase domain-containing protein [Novosphingobium sp. AP12]EJL30858.1 methylase involved in ubiquinone/menaquinone biosynthesis [Novosphingobium sp. AP12]